MAVTIVESENRLEKTDSSLRWSNEQRNIGMIYQSINQWFNQSESNQLSVSFQIGK